MSSNLSQDFPGKVLLFGEYSVILGQEALALPIKNFSGHLQLTLQESEHNISPFIQYLGALHQFTLDQELLESLELDKLVFESNIPIGYGAGSSGALTAAVYQTFVKNQNTDFKALKDDLASLEDYFHGSSSGLDPMVSYLKQAVHVKKGSFDILELNGQVHQSLDNFYLVDTGISRSTGPLVEIFKKKMKSAAFENLIVESFGSINHNAIQALLVGDRDELSRSLQEISNFQFENFQEMIPQGFKSIWHDTLNEKRLAMKLCGAGGGGFLLAHHPIESEIRKWADKKMLRLEKLES